MAFAAQHVNTYKREIEQVRLSAADRDRLALVVCCEIVRPFTRGETPPSGEEVAVSLNTPVRLVNEILYELSKQGILRVVTRLVIAAGIGRSGQAIVARDVQTTSYRTIVIPKVFIGVVGV